MMTLRRRANPDGTAGAMFWDVVVPITTILCGLDEGVPFGVDVDGIC